MISKGKAVTLIGVVIGAIGVGVSQPDVQSTFDPKWAPFIQLFGTVLAAAGASLVRSTKSETRKSDKS